MAHSLTIKGIPELLYKRLKQRATTHHRSINSEVITCLEVSLQSSRLDPETFLERADVLRKRLALPQITEEALRQAKTAGRP